MPDPDLELSGGTPPKTFFRPFEPRAFPLDPPLLINIKNNNDKKIIRIIMMNDDEKIIILNNQTF